MRVSCGDRWDTNIGLRRASNVVFFRFIIVMEINSKIILNMACARFVM